MTYQPISVAAQDSQLAEQWNLTALGVAMAFHVPPYKLGLQSDLKFNNMQQQDMDYYKQCLQTHIESIESTLGDGLGLPRSPVEYRICFDTSGLFRMDPLAMAQTDAELVKGSILAPNEARAHQNLPPVPGGDEPIAQQQNWPLGALARRGPPIDAAQAAKDTVVSERAVTARRLAMRFRSSSPRISLEKSHAA
jgi:phage portal protein BeeE